MITSGPTARRAPDLVVLLSIDGLGASYIDDPALELPALRGLAARGARARLMRVIFPSVTWPCHTSLVTGVSPARHGIIGNMVFDRDAGVPVEHFGDRNEVGIRAETLWDRLRARGERTASICWPKTRGVAAIPDNIPEFYEQDLFERYASRPLWTELARAGLPVDRYGPWSAAHALGPMQDWLTLEAARHVLATRPPRLLLLHFLTLDSFQHDHGIGSPEARWALREMDALLGRLLDSLAALGRLETTALLVFGDHGFAEVRATHHLNQMVRELGLLELDGTGAPTRRHAWVAGNGGAAYVYTLEGAPRTAGGALRERFGALPGVETIGPAQYADLGLPAPGPGSHGPDLVLAADDGVFFTGHATPEAAAAAPVYRAAHGHRPELAPLGAAFLMAGPGVRPATTLGEISLLSVGPTAARLLGVELPGAEARPLDEALDLARA
ncbi:MAG TPA: ectonucleotide pyrophosphatase/phosphodiesterase [Vicinamibacteria bacterium]|nr:ectonucleotide pyrophosphatase/phosphodiesterase [Vicinamibacteria bacterium]